MSVVMQWPKSRMPEEISAKIRLSVALKTTGADLIHLSGRLMATGAYAEPDFLTESRQQDIILEAKDLWEKLGEEISAFVADQKGERAARAVPLPGPRDVAPACSPHDVKNTVISVIAKILGCEIAEHDELGADLGADEVERTTIVMELERKLNITLPSELDGVATVGDLVAGVRGAMLAAQ